jgi:hypothetical protein
MAKEKEQALGPAGVRRLLEGQGSLQDLTQADLALYLDLLDEKFQSIDGSDTRILDDLRAGGHPIASSDGMGGVIIETPRRKGSRT